MRALRLSLVGTIILILLGAMAAVAVAREDPEALEDPHPVTGQSWAGTWMPGSTEFDAERGVLERYGRLWSHRFEMNDPRLTGTMWSAWNSDVTSSGLVATGTVELVDDGGSWVGTAREYGEAQFRHVFLELTGTGGYAEHAALLYWRGDPENASPWDIDGFALPGTLPPYPDPVVVSAQ